MRGGDVDLDQQTDMDKVAIVGKWMFPGMLIEKQVLPAAENQVFPMGILCLKA